MNPPGNRGILLYNSINGMIFYLGDDFMNEINKEDITEIKRTLKVLSEHESMDIFIEIMSFIAKNSLQRLSYDMDENTPLLNAAIFHAAWKHPHVSGKLMRELIDKVCNDKESIDMCNEFINLLE